MFLPEGLCLGPLSLNGIEIRTVRGQKQQPVTGSFDRPDHVRAFVKAGIVHDDDTGSFELG